MRRGARNLLLPVVTASQAALPACYPCSEVGFNQACKSFLLEDMSFKLGSQISALGLLPSDEVAPTFLECVILGSLFLEVAPSCVQLQSSVYNQTFLLYMQCSDHILLIFLMKMMYGGFLFCVLGSLICCAQYGRSMFRIDLPHVHTFIRLCAYVMFSLFGSPHLRGQISSQMQVCLWAQYYKSR